MTCLNPDLTHGLPAEPWLTDDETAILDDLKAAEYRFWTLPRDHQDEYGTFKRHIEELEKLIVLRLARRTAEKPMRKGHAIDPDDVEMHLRWLADSETRERREAYLMVYAIIGISAFAAFAAAFRFFGMA